MQSRARLILVIVLLATAGGFVLAYRWYDRGRVPTSNPNADKPIPVRSGVAEVRNVPEVYSTSGFVTPLNVVEMRPQISATVRSVDIKEGRMVRIGQRMFTLDDRSDAANEQKIRAQAIKDRALLEDAKRALARNLDLKARGFVSQSTVDSAQSNVDALAAALDADQAAVRAAQVSVGFAAITAPMSGRVGEIKVHIGSLVQPTTALAMTTITQIDPIEITFNVPEKEAQKLLAAQRAGRVVVKAHVDNKVVDGRLSFVDSAVDSASGNLKAKAEFANPDSLLWSGTLVTVDLVLRTLEHAVVISPRAVQVGPAGQFVYRIEPDGQVSSRPIKVDYLTSDLAVVSGLEGGSKVVTEGGQNLRPGLHVTVAPGDSPP